MGYSLRSRVFLPKRWVHAARRWSPGFRDAYQVSATPPSQGITAPVI